MRKFLRRKSTIAFVMALPLILVITLLVLYPALYSLHLATLNKSMEHFVGLGNFEFLFKRETFWMVVKQSIIFAVSAVVFKARSASASLTSCTTSPPRASASGVACFWCRG